jgi:hypothetical protein
VTLELKEATFATGIDWVTSEQVIYPVPQEAHPKIPVTELDPKEAEADVLVAP